MLVSLWLVSLLAAVCACQSGSSASPASTSPALGPRIAGQCSPGTLNLTGSVLNIPPVLTIAAWPLSPGFLFVGCEGIAGFQLQSNTGFNSMDAFVNYTAVSIVAASVFTWNASLYVFAVTNDTRYIATPFETNLPPLMIQGTRRLANAAPWAFAGLTLSSDIGQMAYVGSNATLFHFFVADRGSHVIVDVGFEASSPAVVSATVVCGTVGQPGWDASHLASPFAIASDTSGGAFVGTFWHSPQGDAVVALQHCSATTRVTDFVVARAGNLLTSTAVQFGSLGIAGLAFDENTHLLYVSDPGNLRILTFSPSVSMWWLFSDLSVSTGPDPWWCPGMIPGSISLDGTSVYVVDAATANFTSIGALPLSPSPSLPSARVPTTDTATHVLGVCNATVYNASASGGALDLQLLGALSIAASVAQSSGPCLFVTSSHHNGTILEACNLTSTGTPLSIAVANASVTMTFPTQDGLSANSQQLLVALVDGTTATFNLSSHAVAFYGTPATGSASWTLSLALPRLSDDVGQTCMLNPPNDALYVVDRKASVIVAINVSTGTFQVVAGTQDVAGADASHLNQPFAMACSDQFAYVGTMTGTSAYGPSYGTGVPSSTLRVVDLFQAPTGQNNIVDWVVSSGDTFTGEILGAAMDTTSGIVYLSDASPTGSYVRAADVQCNMLRTLVWNPVDACSAFFVPTSLAFSDSQHTLFIVDNASSTVLMQTVFWSTSPCGPVSTIPQTLMPTTNPPTLVPTTAVTSPVTVSSEPSSTAVPYATFPVPIPTRKRRAYGNHTTFTRSRSNEVSSSKSVSTSVSHPHSSTASLSRTSTRSRGTFSVTVTDTYSADGSLSLTPVTATRSSSPQRSLSATRQVTSQSFVISTSWSAEQTDSETWSRTPPPTRTKVLPPTSSATRTVTHVPSASASKRRSPSSSTSNRVTVSTSLTITLVPPIPPPPPVLPPAAMTGLMGATAALSAAGGAAPTSAAQSLLIFGLMACAPQSAQESLKPSSPLLAPFGVGDSGYALLAGNVTLLAAIGLIHLVVAEINIMITRSKKKREDAKVARRKRRREARERRRAHQSSAPVTARTSSPEVSSEDEEERVKTAEEVEREEAAHAEMNRHALAKTRFPALSLRALFFLLPGTAFFAFSQLTSPTNRTIDGMMFGAATIAVCITAIGALHISIEGRLVFDGLYLRFKKAHKGYNLSPTVRRLLLPRGLWLPNHFSHRFGPVMTAAKRRQSVFYFTVVLPTKSIFFGAITSWNPEDTFGGGSCWVQYALVSLLCLAQVACIVRVRPYRHPVANSLAVLSDLALVVLCVSQMTVGLQQMLGQIAIVLVALVSALSALVQFVLTIYEQRVWREAEERSRKRAVPAFGEPRWSRKTAATEESLEFGDSSEEEERLEAEAEKKRLAEKAAAVNLIETKARDKAKKIIRKQRSRSTFTPHDVDTFVEPQPINPLMRELVEGLVPENNVPRGFLSDDSDTRLVNSGALPRRAQRNDVSSDSPSTPEPTSPGPLARNTSLLWDSLPDAKSEVHPTSSKAWQSQSEEMRRIEL